MLKNGPKNSYMENYSKSRGIPWKKQFGFGKGCGTREAVGVVQRLCEISLEHDNELLICFVDFKKAFDKVKWTTLWHLGLLMKILTDWAES